MLFKKILIILVTLFCAAELFASDYSEQQAIIRYNQGVTYQQQGRLDAAIKEYEKAIKWNPELRQAYFNLGLIYIEKKNYTSAERMFKIVIEQNPYGFDGYYYLAIIYLEAEKLASVQSTLEKIRNLYLDANQKKRVAEIYHSLALVYADRKEYTQAKSLLIKASNLDPNDFGIHYNLGIVNTQLGALSEAIAKLKKAVSIDPTNEQGHLALAGLYIQTEQYSMAIAELQQAQKINPTNAETKNIIAALQGQHQPLSTRTSSYAANSATDYIPSLIGIILLLAFFGSLFALKKIQKVLSGLYNNSWKNPLRRATKLSSKAAALKGLGRNVDAVRFYKQAIKILSLALSSEYYRRKESRIISKSIEVREALISICKHYAKTAYLLKNVSYKEIQEQVKKVMSICGERHSLLYMLGELSFLQDRFDESLRYFRGADERERNTLACLWLGLLFYKQSDYIHCIRLLSGITVPIRKDHIKEEYLIDDPKELSKKVILFQGLSYYGIGDWGNAIRCFESLWTTCELDNDAMYYLAKSYEYVGNYNKFVEIINECIRIEPEDPDMIFERAKAYRRMRKLDEAVQDLRKILSFKPEERTLHYELAIVCALKNDFNSSIACFNKMIQLRKDDPRALFKRGMVYEKAAQYDKAIESYLYALQHSKDRRDIYTRVGITYCKCENYEQSLGFFEKAKILGDDSDQYLYYCGLAYAKTNNVSDAISSWEKLSKRSDTNENLLKDIEVLKDRLNDNSKSLFDSLCYEISKKNWKSAYSILKQLKKTQLQKNAIMDMFPYVRNRLCPELLSQNRRAELADVLREGLKDDPTNYTLLHNLTVLYYWWAFTHENDMQIASDTTDLWGSLVGYWTAIVYNDEFWWSWTGQKKWVGENETIEIVKLQNNLIGHMESNILSSIDTHKQKADEISLSVDQESLKKLHYEKRFISYYKELRDVLSDEVSSIPDTYSESLIKELGVQDYIVELADIAIQKYPSNENIKKIKYYLSPFKYIAILLDEKRYLTAIKEIEKLPADQKNNDIVHELTKQAKLRLGAKYLTEGGIQNNILHARTLWSTCPISSDTNALELIERSTTQAIKQYRQEGRLDEAVAVGELALEYLTENQEIISLLSVLLNERGVKRWNASEAIDVKNAGVEDLNRAINYNPDNMVAKKNLAIMYNILGVWYADTGDPNKATDYFMWSLELVPGDEKALKNLKKANYERYREYVSYSDLDVEDEENLDDATDDPATYDGDYRTENSEEYEA